MSMWNQRETKRRQKKTAVPAEISPREEIHKGKGRIIASHMKRYESKSRKIRSWCEVRNVKGKKEEHNNQESSLNLLVNLADRLRSRYFDGATPSTPTVFPNPARQYM